MRSTDLLSLPNVNPDAGFAVQMSIEENLVDMQVVSFQAALLYTSSKGEGSKEDRMFTHTGAIPYPSLPTTSLSAYFLPLSLSISTMKCCVQTHVIDRQMDSLNQSGRCCPSWSQTGPVQSKLKIA